MIQREHAPVAVDSGPYNSIRWAARRLRWAELHGVLVTQTCPGRRPLGQWWAEYFHMARRL